MSVWDWVGTIGAIWLAVSFVVAIGWVLSGKRIFRKPPQPPVRTSSLRMVGQPARVVVDGVDVTPHVVRVSLDDEKAGA